jgi:hypothetical protein
MSEHKAFASLSSGLLARKGAARPAMRPQGFGQVGQGLEDLGWNDMGDGAHAANEGGDEAFEPAQVQPLRNPLAGLSPVPSPVHDQQASIEDRYSYGEEEEGEGENGDYVDETAELFDPESEDEDAFTVNLSPVAKRQPIISRTAEEDEEALELNQQAVDPSAYEAAVQPVHFEPAPAPVHFEPAVAKTPTQAAPKRAPRARSAPGAKGKAAFTLRLDGERHLKLRLACAVDGRSAQQLVTEALDRLLADMPELNAMAERAAKKPAA